MRHFCKWIALGICGLLAVLTILLVLPGLFHIYPLAVQSGSMAPSYQPGSMIYVKRTDEDRLREGMVVSFYLADEETLVTHRIVRVDEKERLIYTKGDANLSEDSAATPFSRVLGQAVFCIPCLGTAAVYLSSPAGKVGIFLAVVLVCILSWMDGALQRQEDEAQRG